MSRQVDDCLTIMRNVLSRRNTNDPSSSDAILIRHLNDFVITAFPHITRFIELNGTLEFTINTTPADGVYTFNDVGASSDFASISLTAYVDNNPLNVYLNPVDFYGKWDQFTVADIPTGMPIDMLYYGNQFVFRGIPDQSYTVRIFGYTQIQEFDESTTDAGNEDLPFSYYVRYFAYGGALNFALDNNYDDERLNKIKMGFKREKKNLMARTHHQLKIGRTKPSFI